MKKFEPTKKGIYKYEVYDYNGNYIPYELRVEVLGESDSGKTYYIKTLEVGVGRFSYIGTLLWAHKRKVTIVNDNDDGTKSKERISKDISDDNEDTDGYWWQEVFG